jgi:ribosomal protein S21
MQVKLRKNETVEHLLKRFSRKVKNAKLMDEILEKRYYKKPSEKKREKHFERMRLIEKNKRKEQEEEERHR